MPVCPQGFKKRLKEFDPLLDMIFNPIINRWMIVIYLDGRPASGHDKAASRIKNRLRFRGMNGDAPIFTLDRNYWVLGHLQTADGGYMEPCDAVIRALRAGDLWNRGSNAMVHEGYEDEEAMEAQLAEERMDRQVEIERDLRRMTNPSIDLGGAR